jgi:hypothetical protein
MEYLKFPLVVPANAGPITTGLNLNRKCPWQTQLARAVPIMTAAGVWGPAFAGTTN